MLRAIAEGVCRPDVVSSEELSKKGKPIYDSIVYLLSRRAKPPIAGTSILLTASEIFGADPDDTKAYLKSLKDLETGSEVATILRAARDKTLLVQVINEAGTQLSKGSLRIGDLARLLEKGQTVDGDATRSLSESVGNKFPEPPCGIPLRSLPGISSATGGLVGIWIVGGEPGLGKSTLCWQLGLDAAQNVEVVYYDLDGTGRTYLLDRTRKICGNSLKHFKRLTKKFYYREAIDSLEEDLSLRKPPAVFVIDSLQALPTGIKFKKESLDAWILRFKQLTKKGYVFLMVSEQNRANYGEARMAGYKGSGDIEYAGTLCAQLLPLEGDETGAEFHIVKNRHGTRKGHIIDLARDAKRVFWFNEEEPDA